MKKDAKTKERHANKTAQAADTPTTTQPLQSAVKRYVVAGLTLLMCAIFPVIYLYAQNAGITALFEIVRPSLFYIAGILAVAAIIFIITRSPAKSAIIACVFFMLFMNYSLIESGVKQLLPQAMYWQVAAVLLYFALVIGWLITSKMKEKTTNLLSPVLCLFFCVLVLMNAVIAVPKAAQAAQARSKITMQNEMLSDAGTMPNIYFLLFDEACGFDTIRDYYQYDPQWFIDWLDKRGFTVSESSRNESIQTRVVTANLTNIDYVAAIDMPDAMKNEIAYGGGLFPLFRNNGYEIYPIGSVIDLYYGMESIVGEADASARTAGGGTFEDILFQATALEPFLGQEDTNQGMEIIFAETGYFFDPGNLGGSNKVFWLHTMFPHPPFVFTEYGHRVKRYNEGNWTDSSIYLGQYIYSLKRAQQMISTILETDPDSIIVFASDHGARQGCLTENGFLTDITFDMMRNCINSVYYRGEDISEVKDHSLINTMRLILNRLLGTQYQIVEVPGTEAFFWEN